MPLHLFRAGKQVDSNGVARNFTAADLAASAKAYNPKLHEAPIVVGHPKTDAPAYGWIKSVSANGDDYEGEAHQVDSAFAVLHAEGKFKKISAAFYPPDSPSNPVPGVWYLRHVGFLGAQPPAVKGLRSPEFSDADEFVTFSEVSWGFDRIASLFRRLRDAFISEKGLEKADELIPDWEIESIKEAGRADRDRNANAFADPATSATPSPAFSEGNSGENMDPTALKALQDSNADLQAKLKAEQEAKAKLEAQFAEKEQKQKADADAAAAKVRHDEHVAFCESLVKAGKLLPVHQGPAVALMDSIAVDAQVEFGEGDKKVTQTTVAWFKGFLEKQNKQVEFKETGKPGATLNVDDPVEFAEAIREFIDEEAKHGRSVNEADAATLLMQRRAA